MRAQVQQTENRHSTADTAGISKEDLDFKIDFLTLKIEQIERKMANKADDVISIQVLQHRRELDDIYQTIEHIDEQIRNIDHELSDFSKMHHLNVSAPGPEKGVNNRTAIRFGKQVPNI